MNRVEFLVFKGLLKFYKVQGSINYNLKVPSEKHKQALDLSERFTNEALSFLDQDTLQLLKPLRLSPSQLALVYFTLNNWKEGHLNYAGDYKQTTSGRADLRRTYSCINVDPNASDVLDKIQSLKFANFYTCWLVDEQKPRMFTHMGATVQSLPSVLQFITLPNKASEVEDLASYLTSSIEYQKGGKINTFQDGQRIILDYNSVTWIPWKRYRNHVTLQYHYLGQLDSETMDRSYWIYGHNDLVDLSSSPSVKSSNVLETSLKGI